MSFKVDFLERKVYSRVRDVVYLRDAWERLRQKNTFDITDKMYPHISLYQTILDIRTWELR